MKKVDSGTQALLDAAVRLLKTHEMTAEDVVYAVYILGRAEGGIHALNRAEALTEDFIRPIKEVLQ